ncbi:DNA primase [Jeotgalicoccus aerolatus]|uniref:DNA primase n=1 Tax=Jeotgalicoccus aerolatus TaxID=709510 RepID=A0ABS4HL93_9STAP|nr:DNA primase [Jeotgalicoccus aerolatus]MBP1951695.1 DNA primase [Jeotgalicoccus aerolatus]NMA80461.1 DNA primase [Jeotgalicoccus aerolatus]CAD2075554.1 DNA primase [Jeotgalicoccus aerolatus]GGD95517.1 DNA primase [Jeotgalicoccus aerolatus]HJG33302.1 DNA primase [Jeotgalicoccus aerolatus]
MRIPEETIAKIKDETDITELVASYIKLERRGRNYVGLCPFHDEKTPSFSVSPDKQIAHCFGCKKGGNVFQFLMEIENVSFAEAAQKLGEPLNIKIDTQTNDVAESDMTLIRMHDYMTDLYHHLLMNTNEGEKPLQYMLDRGFSPELIRSEKIGFAPNMSYFAKNALLEQGYNEETAYQAGLLSRNEENFSYYDRFVGRIMIPIKNHQGHHVGFTARSVDGSEPKYLNTPETEIFKKRELFFNLHDARKYVRKLDNIILMEGHLDVLKVKMTKVKHIVATMGTELSQENLNLLERLASNVTIMFDGDSAGRNATLKVGDILLQRGMNVYVQKIPDKMDPDEYIETYGDKQFEQFIDERQQHYLHFKAEMLRHDAKENDMKFSKNLNIIAGDLKYVKDRIAAERLVTSISSIFGVDKNVLSKKIPEPVQQTQDYYPIDEPVHAQLSLRQKKERYVTRIMMTNPSYLMEYKDNLDEYVLTYKPYYDIVRGLCVYFETHDVFDLSLALNYLDPALTDTLIELDGMSIHEDVSHSEINDYLEDLSGIRNSENEKQELNRKLEIAEQENDIELQIKLTQELIELNRIYKM